MRVVDTSPDAYLASIAETHRDNMMCIDQTIHRAMPERARVLWQGVFWGGTHQSIIGYGHITQRRSPGDPVEWFHVGLALQKKNYSIDVNATGGQAYLAHSFADRLGKASIGAASIGFRRLDDLDLAVLTEIATQANRLTPPDPDMS